MLLQVPWIRVSIRNDRISEITVGLMLVSVTEAVIGRFGQYAELLLLLLLSRFLS